MLSSLMSEALRTDPLSNTIDVMIEMVLPQCRLEQQGMARGGGNEFPLSARRQKLFKISPAVPYSIVLVMTAVQPKRRNSGWGSTFEDGRVYDFMIGATSAKRNNRLGVLLLACSNAKAFDIEQQISVKVRAARCVRCMSQASRSKPVEAEMADATAVHQQAVHPAVSVAGEGETVAITEKMVRSDGCQCDFSGLH